MVDQLDLCKDETKMGATSADWRGIVAEVSSFPA